jgi:hypothetical protein
VTGPTPRGFPTRNGAKAVFPANRSRRQTETATYLDTLDRRVLAAGDTFETVPGRTGVELSWKHGATSLRARSGDRPRFAKNLPAGPLREGLSALIAGRRLVPLVVVERRIEEFGVRDEKEKTTARLRVVVRRVRAPEQIPYSSLVEQMSVQRLPLPVLAPHGDAAQAFERLWHEILARLASDDPGTAWRRSTRKALDELARRDPRSSGVP